MSNKIKCTCGHSWNKSSSSKKDMNICHICGKDNTMQMGGFVYPVNYVPQKENGGWLDAYDDAPQAENGIEGTMGGLTDQGFNYNGAWGGPSMQNGGQSSADSVRHQANKILQYEQLKGGPGGTPLPQYSNPKYMQMLMQNVYPEVKKIMPNASAMEAGEAMDFIFNAGWDKNNNKITKDPRAFALQEYYRQNDKSKLDSDGKWSGRKNPAYSFDQEYSSTIGKLPENERRILMNKGRDWYYQNINNPSPGVPSSDYKDTWYGRIWNTNDYNEFNPNNPKFFPKKQMGGNLPGAVGSMYARTGAPSKGPRRNQTDVTDASAQNGMEMKFYQEGLDWKPRNISRDGGWLSKYEDDVPKAQNALTFEDLVKATKTKAVSESTNSGIEKKVANQIGAQESSNKKAEQQVQTLINKGGYSEAHARRAVKTKEAKANSILEKVNNDTYRTQMHPDFDPNKSVDEQSYLLNDDSFRTRVLRGANMLTNTGNPVGDFATSMITAPGRSFANLTMDAGNRYFNPNNTGVGNFANFAEDVVEVFPSLIPKTAGALGQAENLVSQGFKGFAKTTNPTTIGSGDELVTTLRKNLLEKGILSQQKTLNLPWKNIIRKGVRPWGYSADDKIKDLKSLFIDSENPYYLSPEDIDNMYKQYIDRLPENISSPPSKEEYISLLSGDEQRSIKSNRAKVNYRFNNRFSNENDLASKNRYATWDMYLGKPQTEHPMYDVSDLTKSKDDVIYTIKEDYINKNQVKNAFQEYISLIEDTKSSPSYKTDASGNYIIPDQDSQYFGTMGGFHWNLGKLPDGNYQAIANDLWDLHPFNYGFSNSRLPKYLRNMEVGKALGIGKPINTKVGFIIDKDTKDIIKTFKKGGDIKKDDNGYWNPENWGKPVEIGSNEITMQGVYEPLIGVSDEGDVQYMEPGQDYKFKGKKVTEYPVKKNGGWLNKYK